MTPEQKSAGTLAKTAKGAAWIVAWRMATRTLGLLSTIVLVRLLTPGDYGLIALATSFNQSIEAFSWFGIEDALIREKSPTRTTYDTAFTMALLRGLSLTVIIAALAYPAAGFFAEPRLATVILMLALATLLDGFNNVGTVDFRRDFNFHLEFRLWIVPRILSTVMAITAAVFLRNYWALVIGILASRVMRVVAGYIMHSYRPRLSLREWRKLTSYSFWTWVHGICTVIAGQSDTFMIGRMLGTTQVGFYSLGNEMAFLPQTEFVEPLGRSTFSAFAEGRNQDRAPADIWVRIASAAALLVFPAAIGISLVADNLLLVFFGPGWHASLQVVQVLGVLTPVALLGSISGCLFRAYGQLRTMVSVSVGVIVLRLVLLAVLMPTYGLVGAAVAIGIALLVEQATLTSLAFRQMGASLVRDLLPQIWRCVVSVAVMAAGLDWLGLGWVPHVEGQNPYTQLGIISGIGAVIYIGCLSLLWWLSGKPEGPEADVLGMLKRSLIKLRSTFLVLVGRPVAEAAQAPRTPASAPADDTLTPPDARHDGR